MEVAPVRLLGESAISSQLSSVLHPFQFQDNPARPTLTLKESETMLTKKKILLVTAALMMVAGAAFAYWTNTGSGTGSATTGTNSPITIVQTGSSVTLQPGGASSTLSGTFTNPNTSPVFVSQVTATLASVSGAGTSALGCTTADYALTTPTITINAEVSPDDTTTWSGIEVRLLNRPANQNDCKNATINLAYTSN